LCVFFGFLISNFSAQNLHKSVVYMSFDFVIQRLSVKSSQFLPHPTHLLIFLGGEAPLPILQEGGGKLGVPLVQNVTHVDRTVDVRHLQLCLNYRHSLADNRGQDSLHSDDVQSSKWAEKVQPSV